MALVGCRDSPVSTGAETGTDTGGDGADDNSIPDDAGDDDTTGDDGMVDDESDDDPDTTGQETGDMACLRPGGSSGGPTECDADCGNSDFDLEHISGFNYTSSLVHLLSPTCVGPSCPAPLASGTYGDEAIVPCEETAEAMESPRGPQAYCRIIPLTLSFGLDIGFTRSPDPDTITLNRPSIANPTEDEPYVWRSGITELRGPSTAFNGRYERGSPSFEPPTISVRNLTCRDNLEAQGIEYDPDELQAACAATYEVDGATQPLRLQANGVFRPVEGRLDARSFSCDTPDAGPDTCCSACDYELSVNVAKYGVDPMGVRRSPNAGTALACNPSNDRFEQCRDFRTQVDRTNEVATWRYEWNGCLKDWSVPLHDRVRKTHPDDRPPGTDAPGVTCSDDGDCTEGRQCIGTNDADESCSSGDDCQQRRCRAAWFVDCIADPNLGPASSYCVDTRTDDRRAAGCYETTAAFEGSAGEQPAGSRLSWCDIDLNGFASGEECCQTSLGDEMDCDPLFQGEVEAIDRFDRHPELPTEGQCVCSDDAGQPDGCEPIVQASCEEPIGAGTDPGGAAPAEGYAHQVVRRRGGARYNEELDGFDLVFAHRGNSGRALVEECSESRGLIDTRSPVDAWLAHDNMIPTFDHDYDIAMCSSSSYELVFAGPDDQEHVAAPDGATLAGKQRYVLETSDFLVVPGSGFPSDNLQISACDDVSLRVTNKYDLSTDNQRKISIWRVETVGDESTAVERVAGGRDCDPTATQGDVAMGVIPCLEFNARNFDIGEFEVSIDFDRYGSLLEEGLRYRVVVPGLSDLADIADPDAYAEAFHDACGMPLLYGDLPESEYEYDFTVDNPC